MTRDESGFGRGFGSVEVTNQAINSSGRVVNPKRAVGQRYWGWQSRRRIRVWGRINSVNCRSGEELSGSGRGGRAFLAGHFPSPAPANDNLISVINKGGLSLRSSVITLVSISQPFPPIKYYVSLCSNPTLLIATR